MMIFLRACIGIVLGAVILPAALALFFITILILFPESGGYYAFVVLVMLSIPTGAISGGLVGAIGMNTVRRWITWQWSGKTENDEAALDLNKRKANLALQCFWMLGIPLFTVIFTLVTHSDVAKYVVFPATVAVVFNWIVDQSPMEKSLWRSISVGLLASLIFLLGKI